MRAAKAASATAAAHRIVPAAGSIASASAPPPRTAAEHDVGARHTEGGGRPDAQAEPGRQAHEEGGDGPTGWRRRSRRRAPASSGLTGDGRGRPSAVRDTAAAAGPGDGGTGQERAISAMEAMVAGRDSRRPAISRLCLMPGVASGTNLAAERGCSTPATPDVNARYRQSLESRLRRSAQRSERQASIW